MMNVSRSSANTEPALMYLIYRNLTSDGVLESSKGKEDRRDAGRACQYKRFQ